MFFSFFGIRYTELESRTVADICRRYKTDNRDTYKVYNYPGDSRFTYYVQQGESCSIKSYNRTGDDDVTLRQLNFFRWLTGFKTPIYLDHKFDDQQTKCSIINIQRGSISHRPDSSAKCYTQDGFTGCRSSNLAQLNNIRTGATAIGQFICDNGNPTIGHRRWVLHDNLIKTSFGAAIKGTDLTLAMRCFDSASGWVPSPKNNDKVLFTAYPSPGYFPVDLVYPYWSFWSESMPSASGVKVSVKIDGKPQTVQVSELGQSYNFRAGVVFTISGYDNEARLPYKDLAGKTIDVTISQGGNTWEYTVKPVDCQSWKDIPPPEEPTHSIPTKDKPSQSQENQPTAPITSGEIAGQGGTGDDDKNKPEEKSKLVPILIGCGIAVVIIIIVIVVGIILYKRRNLHSHDPEDRHESDMYIV